MNHPSNYYGRLAVETSGRQLLGVLLVTLVCCSCRTGAPSLSPDQQGQSEPQPTWQMPTSAAAAPIAGPITQVSYDDPAYCQITDAGGAAFQADSQWSPPGIAGPWPADEYLLDGGDRNYAVVVNSDWTVDGLDSEDTVIHYDTLDGNTNVEPANSVAIYAPRFAAVRKVTGIAVNEQTDILGEASHRTAIRLHDDLQIAGAVNKPVQVGDQTGRNVVWSFRERLQGVGLEKTDVLFIAQDGNLPRENVRKQRRETFETLEGPRLSQSNEAAKAWSLGQAPQVTFDNVEVAAVADTEAAESVYTYELPPGKPRVRIIKSASKRDALPGETVEFVIRFDNIGDQVVGNVAIMDNLTPRLEYVPGSAESSLDASFSAENNDAGSLVLKWEVNTPVKPSGGGVIRFTCRVR